MSGYEQRAREFAKEWPAWSPHHAAAYIRALTDLCEPIAAEARGQAIEGCCAAAEALREGPNTPTIGALVETMRRTIGAPRPDVRLVAREDLVTVIEAAAELEQRIRAERAGYDVSRAEEIRAAVARKEE